LPWGNLPTASESPSCLFGPGAAARRPSAVSEALGEATETQRNPLRPGNRPCETLGGADPCRGGAEGRTLPPSCRSRTRLRRSAPLIYPSGRVTEAPREEAEKPLETTSGQVFFVGTCLRARQPGARGAPGLGGRAPTLVRPQSHPPSSSETLRGCPRHLSKVRRVLHDFDLSQFT
jgi:hypothetical protein